MKIIVISDLHANFDALSALPESGDELWVLGDLVDYGPQPAEVVDYIQTYATAAVRGNHDHAVGYNVDPRCTPRYHEMAVTTMEFSKAELNDPAKDFLRNLPLTLRMERDCKWFSLCHAMPSDPLYGYCPEESDHWLEEVSRAGLCEPDYLLVGHTHTPFIRTIGRTTIVNPGSLGQPKTGKADACYAVWENNHFELKQYAYPVERTVARLKALPIAVELQHDLATVLRTGSL